MMLVLATTLPRVIFETKEIGLMAEMLRDEAEEVVKPLRPRARILKTARDLFHQYGIHAVSVDAIATAAQTNKMTLYRHFISKDELIAATIRELQKDHELGWEALAQAHGHDPHAHFDAWLLLMCQLIEMDDDDRCQLMNRAIEIPDAHHPARLAIEEVKRGHIHRIAGLCRALGLNDPEALAEKLFVVIEGARMSRHIGTARLAAQLPQMVQALVVSHTPI